ncbi:hypothetical protein CEXT_604661 [Caerostris extrusa]|uniref:Uncharacterized protein n=1 Tax=Caerostris extrusa TaxID=172846 RepID=A0AAV4US91_CAEEX|nr:hypothetical protein CEXT_604661 [Caerostris extrusa]
MLPLMDHLQKKKIILEKIFIGFLANGKGIHRHKKEGEKKLKKILRGLQISRVAFLDFSFCFWILFSSAWKFLFETQMQIIALESKVKEEQLRTF